MEIPIWKYFGILSSLGTVALWFILIFHNPYHSAAPSNDVLIRTGAFLAAPAFVAGIGTIIKKRFILFLAFIWSLPLSLYMAMTPSIFKLFIAASLCYLLAGILMGKEQREVE
ncbi:hypothetical protein H8B09_23270 [Paenibacillus sp. PR3]|uniref:Uncharacterized protein n=1 Tax=Paenibacillus terricola TaxID=2763503 RepID=A0ABR8N2D9_9BACL|nr:hypothetical protein [Paenibacillus terricola]MBD3921706.1 hypothetical protein [Paenibacillus terricola]